MADPATDRFISDYERFNRNLERPHPYFQRLEYIKVNKMMIREVLRRKHKRVLDIGGGSGFLITALSEISDEPMILDIEDARLIQIGKCNRKVSCLCANVELCIPVQSDYFDVVIASELLEHLNHPDLFYSECHRVLRRGGILILTTPNSDNLTLRFFNILPRFISHPLAKAAQVDLKLHPELMDDLEDIADKPHLHKVEGYTRVQLEEFGKNHGLRTVFYKNFGLPVPDKMYSGLPASIVRFIVDHLEDHFPGALRHFIVYENK